MTGEKPMWSTDKCNRLDGTGNIKEIRAKQWHLHINKKVATGLSFRSP